MAYIASYNIDRHEIKRVEGIRDLGVYIDRQCKFGTHIEAITGQARQTIAYIKKIAYDKFTMQTQKLLYLSYVRSRLEFASSIWNPYQELYKDKMESIQKQFVIIITAK